MLKTNIYYYGVIITVRNPHAPSDLHLLLDGQQLGAFLRSRCGSTSGCTVRALGLQHESLQLGIEVPGKRLSILVQGCTAIVTLLFHNTQDIHQGHTEVRLELGHLGLLFHDLALVLS